MISNKKFIMVVFQLSDQPTNTQKSSFFSRGRRPSTTRTIPVERASESNRPETTHNDFDSNSPSTSAVPHVASSAETVEPVEPAFQSDPPEKTRDEFESNSSSTSVVRHVASTNVTDQCSEEAWYDDDMDDFHFYDSSESANEPEVAGPLLEWKFRKQILVVLLDPNEVIDHSNEVSVVFLGKNNSMLQ